MPQTLRHHLHVTSENCPHLFVFLPTWWDTTRNKRKSVLLCRCWPFNLHKLTLWLPASHTLLPDHKWGSPVDGWPTGTPLLPLWTLTETVINDHGNVSLILGWNCRVFDLALRVFSELVRIFQPFITGMAQAATGWQHMHKHTWFLYNTLCVCRFIRRSYCSYLWSFLNLNQTHAAVSCHGEALVVTEPGDLDSCLFTGLMVKGTRYNLVPMYNS